MQARIPERAVRLLSVVALLIVVQPVSLFGAVHVDTDVMDAGGGFAGSATVGLHGCLGQPIMGPMAGGPTTVLTDGFLQTMGPPALPPSTWEVELVVSTSGGTIVQSRIFGEHVLATEGFDPDLDEVIPPPGFTFYSYFEGVPPFSYLSKSMKPYQDESIYWTLSILNAFGEDYTIAWLYEDLPSEGWELYIDGQDMREVDHIDRSGNAQFVIEAYFTDTSVGALEVVATPTESGSVVLRWTSDYVSDVIGYNVYRSLPPAEEFELLNANPVPATPTCEFEDRTAWSEATFRYEIYGLTPDGEEGSEPLGCAWVQTDGLLTARLYAARPNPFTQKSTLSFEVPGINDPIRLLIYDVSGRLVREVFHGPLSRGRHELVWNGKNQLGLETSDGVYFCRLEAGGQHDSCKLVKLAR